MKIIKLYIIPFCCGILLLSILSGWAYREMVSVRQQARQVMRESSEAVLKSLEGSIRSQVRQGRFARDRLQAILDNVVVSTGITFVQFRLNNTPQICAGSCPDQLSIPRNASGNQHRAGLFILWSSVRLQDCPLEHKHGHKGRLHKHNLKPFPADLDLRQQEQILVVGISDRHYSRSVSEAENRLLMLLCFGSFSIIIFLGAWCLAIRNRSLAEALTASHAREAHLEELGLSAAGLAHETKNPLGIIRGLAQRISKGNMPKQEINKITESIMNEVDTAGARLNMFMAYAKSKTPQLKPLEAGKFLKRIAGLLEPDCAAAGLTLTASAAPDFILADSDMLQQILVNLILNSLQASDAGSRIMVNIKSSGAKATLIVKDQGRGIPIEIKSDIFKPYTSGRSGGHGLGLAIVNRIVEDHGWTIDAKPAPEGGTVINISGIAVAANGEYD